MFFATFGNNAMYQDLTGRFDFLAVTASQDDNAAIVGALMVCVLIAILSFLKWIEEDKPYLKSAYPERSQQ